MKQTTAGLIILDKPEGLTSFRALGSLKKALATKKIGHCGTLDLFASGLLLVFVEEATRLVPWFVGKDKSYTATIKFGTQTDTLDPGGKIIAQAEVPTLSKIQSILPSFIGQINQIPPAYSAIHINGKRAYERVLAGEEPELKARAIRIDSIEFLDWSEPFLTVQVACSSGTYIRSLARDIALACGSVAHLSALRRSSIGSLTLDRAISIRDDHIDAIDLITGREVIEMMADVQTIDLKDQFESDFKMGKKIQAEWFTTSLDFVQSQSLMVICRNSIVGVVNLSPDQFISYQQVFPRGI